MSKLPTDLLEVLVKIELVRVGAGKTPPPPKKKKKKEKKEGRLLDSRGLVGIRSAWSPCTKPRVQDLHGLASLLLCFFILLTLTTHVVVTQHWVSLRAVTESTRTHQHRHGVCVWGGGGLKMIMQMGTRLPPAHHARHTAPRTQSADLKRCILIFNFFNFLGAFFGCGGGDQLGPALIG